MEQYMVLSAIGGLTLIEIERKLARIEAYEQNEKDLEYIIEEQAKQIAQLTLLVEELQNGNNA